MRFISREKKSLGNFVKIWAVFSVFAFLTFLSSKVLIVPFVCAQGVYPPVYGFQGFGHFGLPSQMPFYAPYTNMPMGVSSPLFYGQQGFAGFMPNSFFMPLVSGPFYPQPFPGWPYPTQPSFFSNRYLIAPSTPANFTPYNPSLSQGWRFPRSYNSSTPLYNTFLPPILYPGLFYPNQNPVHNPLPSQQVIPLPRPETSSEYPIPGDIPQERKEALKEALDWIFDNPAGLQNNTAVEIGEEIMLFYQLYRRAHTQDAKDLCREYISRRIKEIVDYGRLGNPTSGEISVFLPMCEIMVKLGLSLFDYRSFIDQKAVSNSGTYTPTHKIWNTSILERLGFYPPIPLIHLVPQGFISIEFEAGQLMDLMDTPDADELLIMGRFYDIVHEVFPLTSFGEAPLSLLDSQQVSFLRNLIARGIAYFLENPDIDILAELLICAGMIDLNDQTSLDEAYQYILDQQVADGSFGDIPRLTEIGRSSPARHGVFVSVWALIQ